MGQSTAELGQITRSLIAWLAGVAGRLDFPSQNEATLAVARNFDETELSPRLLDFAYFNLCASRELNHRALRF